MSRQNIADLLAFRAVARERSFTRAAAQLGISTSGLSHTIRGLEARLGVRLLARTTRSVALTQAGERLLDGIAPSFDGIEAALAAVGDLRMRPAGLVRITTGSHAARTILQPAISRLLQTYPDIEVELSIDANRIDIVAERFDAGVRMGETVDKDMIAVPIGPYMRMAAVAAPSYLSNRQIPRTPRDLAAHRCINLRFPTLGGLYAWEFERDKRALNVRVEGPLIVNDIGLALQFARDGVGIAFLQEDFVQSDIDGDRLVRLLESWCPPFPGYHLYYPSRRQHSPAFAVLVQALRVPN